VNTRAVAATLAAGYVLATGVWLLAQLHLTLGGGRSVEEVALQAVRALWLVQIVIAALGAPLLAATALVRRANAAAGGPDRAERTIGPRAPLDAAAGVTLVVLAALPLVAFAALAGAALPSVLAAAQACVLGAGVAVGLLCLLVLRFTGRTRFGTLAPFVLQTAGVALGWHFYPAALEWLGL
jgi:hypothetical protein